MASRLRELALWSGAVLGVLALLLGIAVTFFGFGFLVFRSGSMSPGIPTGSLAVSRTVSARQIHAGDVVSVVASNGERVTHRVVTSTVRGDEASLVLKGDANSQPDGEVYQVQHAQRVVAHVPFAGYFIAHVLTPPGLIAAGALSLMLLVVAFTESESESDDDAKPRRHWRGGPDAQHRATPSRPGRRLPAACVVALVVLVSGAGLSLAHVSGTLAYFTDTVSIKAATFDATAVDAPDSVACSVQSQSGVSNGVFYWAPQDPLYSYEITLYQGSTASVTDQVPTTQVNSGYNYNNYATTSDYGLGTKPSAGTYTFTAQVRSYLTKTSGWRSTAVTAGSQRLRIVVNSSRQISSVSCV